MAAVVPTTTLVVRPGFAFRSRIDSRDKIPPLPPAVGGNHHCFKATCKMLDVRGSTYARVYGYGPDVRSISERVEHACELQVLDHRGKRGAKCSPAQTTFLAKAPECSGQVYRYDVSTGTTRRLLA